MNGNVIQTNNIKDALTRALDKTGINLKVWKEGYFGTKTEEELVNILANKLSEELKNETFSVIEVYDNSTSIKLYYDPKEYIK